MNNRGFTLVELLGCLVLVGVVFGIGLYSTRGTLSTTLTTLNSVSENEIYNAAENYLIENGIRWINTGDEYACVGIDDLVDMGYFDYDEVVNYKDMVVRIERDIVTKVINVRELVDNCE